MEQCLATVAANQARMRSVRVWWQRARPQLVCPLWPRLSPSGWGGMVQRCVPATLELMPWRGALAWRMRAPLLCMRCLRSCLLLSGCGVTPCASVCEMAVDAGRPHCVRVWRGRAPSQWMHRLRPQLLPPWRAIQVQCCVLATWGLLPWQMGLARPMRAPPPCMRCLLSAVVLSGCGVTPCASDREAFRLHVWRLLSTMHWPIIMGRATWRRARSFWAGSMLRATI